MFVTRMGLCNVFFFKQKTAYEMRISDWSSDVCSSDLSFDADAFARDPPANDTETNDEIQRLAAAGRGQIDLGRHRLPAAFLAPVDAQAQGIDVGCRVVGGSTQYRPADNLLIDVHPLLAVVGHHSFP